MRLSSARPEAQAGTRAEALAADVRPRSRQVSLQGGCWPVDSPVEVAAAPRSQPAVRLHVAPAASLRAWSEPALRWPQPDAAAEPERLAPVDSAEPRQVALRPFAPREVFPPRNARSEERRVGKECRTRWWRCMQTTQ